jgi:hypothetical protein
MKPQNLSLILLKFRQKPKPFPESCRIFAAPQNKKWEQDNKADG